MDLQELKKQTQTILADVLEKSALSSGDIFVLGLSSSEVIGGHIGKNSSHYQNHAGYVIWAWSLLSCSRLRTC